MEKKIRLQFQLKRERDEVIELYFDEIESEIMHEVCVESHKGSTHTVLCILSIVFAT